MMKTRSEIAAEDLKKRTVMPTLLSAAELEELDVNVRRKAIFSAGVYQGEILSRVQGLVGEMADGKLDRATARALLKSELARLDYEAKPDEARTIKDLRTDRRLNLILDTNAEMARGYGGWLAGQSEVQLALYPAQELVRVGPQPVAPREWRKRWVAAGGRFFKGRMIAGKGDEVWEQISRFGNPYPPFDYNSGMRLRAVKADEVEGLELPEVVKDEAVRTYGGGVTLGAAGMDDDSRKAIKRVFGDLVEFGEDGKVVRQSMDKLEQMYKRALRRVGGEVLEGRIRAISMGEFSGEVATATAALGLVTEGMKISISEDAMYHFLKHHGPRVGEAGERDKSRRSVGLADVLFFAVNWRWPQEVRLGDAARSLELVYANDGRQKVYVVQYQATDKAYNLSTIKIER